MGSGVDFKRVPLYVINKTAETVKIYSGMGDTFIGTVLDYSDARFQNIDVENSEISVQNSYGRDMGYAVRWAGDFTGFELAVYFIGESR